MKKNLIIILLLLISCYSFSEAVLGVILKDAVSSEIKQEKRHEYGVYVEKVLNNGSAKEAGMLKDDIIIMMDSEKVYTLSQIQAMLKLKETGDQSKFVVLRDGKKKTIKVKLGSREDINPTPAYMGIYSDKLSDRRREKIGLDVPYGVQVDVVRDGPCYKAGMKTGDVIVEMDGNKIYAFDQLQSILKAFKAGDEVDLKVFRDGTKKIRLKLGARASEDEIIQIGDIAVSIPELNIDSEFKREFIPFYNSNTLTNDKYIGASVKVVTIAKNEDKPETFVEIQGIIDDTPADESDLKPGDKIIKVDGKVIEDYYDITKLIEKSDMDLNFEFSRKGKKKSTKIKPRNYNESSDIRVKVGHLSKSPNFYNDRDIKNYIPKGEKIQRTMIDDDGNMRIDTDKSTYRVTTDMVGKII